MDENTIPRRRPDAVAQNVEGKEVVVLPLDSEVRVLNVVGSRIWALIDGVRSVEEIARTLSEEFEVDVAAARADTLRFLRELHDGHLLVGD